MEWIETILMEVEGIRGSQYDIRYSKVSLNFQDLTITTTTRTTDLIRVISINFLIKHTNAIF